jgi:hypothetical protein
MRFAMGLPPNEKPSLAALRPLRDRSSLFVIGIALRFLLLDALRPLCD